MRQRDNLTGITEAELGLGGRNSKVWADWSKQAVWDAFLAMASERINSFLPSLIVDVTERQSGRKNT